MPVRAMAESEVKDRRSHHDRRRSDHDRRRRADCGRRLDIDRSWLHVGRRRGADDQRRRPGRPNANIETDSGLRGRYSPEYHRREQ